MAFINSRRNHDYPKLVSTKVLAVLAFCLMRRFETCAFSIERRRSGGSSSGGGGKQVSTSMMTQPLHASIPDSARRSIWERSFSSLLIASMPTIDRRPALAATDPTDEQTGLVSTLTVADRLHNVPTFTLVDTKGVPYMVVGEDAKVTGYFFTSYDEAKRIQQLAKKSADKGIQEAVQELRAKRKKEGLPALSKEQELDSLGIASNPWKDARISAVPMDVAVTLVTKSMYGTKQAGGNYFQIAPSESDVEEALKLDEGGKDELAEGRVPLFYFEDFSFGDDGDKKSPLYFRKSQLIDEWKKRHPKEDIPEVLVTELFAVISEMVKPGGSDEDLTTLVFVPPPESEQKAKECRKKGGSESPFLLGQRIVVL